MPAVHLEETENINTSCYFGVIARTWQLVCFFFFLSNILTLGRLSALTHTKINSALKLLVKSSFPKEFLFYLSTKWVWRKLYKRHQHLGRLKFIKCDNQVTLYRILTVLLPKWKLWGRWTLNKKKKKIKLTL